MSILDTYGDDVMAAASRYIAPPKAEPEKKFSAWRALSAIPRGAAEAGMQVLASGSELAAGGAYMRDTASKDMQAGVPADALQSDLADSLRDRGREFRPDPQTAHVAEELLYGFARGATKIVAGALAAGPAGVVAAGIEEGMTQADELKRQGVTDPNVRAQAGMVQGAGLALAALPAVGTSLKATAALYLAGGPGGFIAQQALTREILRGASPDGVAAQFDPFDPVGLAVASLIPAGFAAWGIRGQRVAAAAKAAEDFRTGPVPSEAAPVASAVRAAYSPEVVDAARVAFAGEARAASRISGDSMPAAAAHETALAKAEEQMARGEPVQVADAGQRLAFSDETVDAYSGQTNHVLTVKSEGGATGTLEYTVFDGKPQISMISVPDQYRRQGLGREMVMELQRKFPDTEIDWGGMTPDGAALRASLPMRRVETEAAASIRELSSVKEKLADLERRADAGEKLASDEADGWNALHDREAELEASIGSDRGFKELIADPLPTFSTAIDQLRAARDDLAGRAPQSEILNTPREQSPAAAPTGTPRNLQAEVIALRKQEIVLNKLLECLNG